MMRWMTAGAWVAAAGLATVAEAATTHTWIGSSGQSYHVAANWDTGLIQDPGDSAILDNSTEVRVGQVASFRTNVAITVLNQTRIVRNNSDNVNLTGGSLTFLDNSDFAVNRLTLREGAILDWHSAGSWTIAADEGTYYGNLLIREDANNALAAVNMSAGLWTLTGSTNSSIDMRIGVFTMTGGKIEVDQRFRIGHGDNTGAVFSMSGNAEIMNISGSDVASQLWMLGDGRLNLSDQALITLTGMSLSPDSRIHFYGEDSRLFIKGDWVMYILTRWEQFLVNDVADPFLLDIGYASIDEEEYTYVGAIPEPSAAALLLSLPALWAWRRRRRR